MTAEHLPPRLSAVDPINRALAEAEAGLLAVADLDPTYLPPQQKKALLLKATRVRDLITAILAKGMAASPEVAEETGARDVAKWLAHESKLRPNQTHADLRVGQALSRSWHRAAAAYSAGQLTSPQVQVMVDALDELERAFWGDPQILNSAELLAKAERVLIAEAPRLSLKELKVVGERIMAYVAPDRVDEAERKRLEEAERRAAAATRLRMHDRGDGSVDLFVRMPEAEATRLSTYLDAFTSPRTDALEHGFIDPATGTRLPADRRRGEAFVALLHTMDPKRMPIHGGDATTMIVTTGLEVLTKGLGTATLGDGTRISASQARLLACKAGIIPAVMGGRSEVLDLGRSKRLFTRSQRVAKVHAHKTCQVEGCDHPAAWCEVHHRDPWAQGGPTDLEKAVLVCSWHHHRIHDPAYTTTHLSEGTVRFHRRT